MQRYTSQKTVTSHKRQSYVADKSTYADLLAPTPSDIVVDAISEGFENAGTSLTVPHTCSGNNRGLLVSVWLWNGTIANPTFNYNGVPLVLVDQVNADAGILYYYGLANPDVGTHDIVVTNDNAVQMFVNAISYNQVDQATPFPTSDTGTSNGTTFSIPLTTAFEQSWLSMTGRSPSRVPTADVGSFVRNTNGISGDAGWILDSDGGRTIGANTLDYNYDPAQTTYFVIAEIKAVASTPVSFTCYLRPLNEEQSASNGVQFGTGFNIIVECEIDIREGDKLTIDGVEYTLRGIVNHDRGGYTRYKRALALKGEKQ